MNKHLKLAVYAILALQVSSSMADEFRINGATTVQDRIVSPNLSAVEAATGHKLKVLGLSTGRGLADLADGKCDMAMVSEPMDLAVLAAKAAGKEVDAKSVVFTVVMMDEIVFVTHPSNPVKSLTLAQIKDMHQGKIKNWKEVGGNDVPVQVYADVLTGGTRALIKKYVLNGEEFGENVSTEHSVKKAASRVSKDEGGIAGVGLGFANDYPLSIVKTSRIERPLGFATMGAPSPKLDQVISAFKTASAKGGK